MSKEGCLSRIAKYKRLGNIKMAEEEEAFMKSFLEKQEAEKKQPVVEAPKKKVVKVESSK